MSVPNGPLQGTIRRVINDDDPKPRRLAFVALDGHAKDCLVIPSVLDKISGTTWEQLRVGLRVEMDGVHETDKGWKAIALRLLRHTGN